MKILLLGEYSNVHCTLAKGLKALGHQVTVVSNGDFWKDYPRDISLVRKPGKLGGIAYMARLYSLLPQLRGYDIVQLINPMFLEIKAERILPVYRYLRRHNRRVVLCAFGMDYYWVSTCCEKKPLRYSDFNIGPHLRHNTDALKERADWLGTPKQHLNTLIARDCHHIVTGLYEYHVCYQPLFPHKTTFIPYPIEMNIPPRPGLTPCPSPKGEGSGYSSFGGHSAAELTLSSAREGSGYSSFGGHYTPLSLWRGAGGEAVPLRLFIGINTARSQYKGTDIMLAAAQDICRRYPRQAELKTAQSVPFATYRNMMTGSDAILDQLYSYTPSMNALEAMSQGIICIGGGEPENYQILNEETLRPIINVQPTYESVYRQLQWLLTHPQLIPQLKQQSIEYIARHHDHIAVAQRYQQLYKKLLEQEQ